MDSNVEMEQGPISAETICDLVGEAINIPSVSKGQPTQFIILNEIESLSKASEIVPHHPLTVQALAAIVVCGDLNMAELKDKWMIDCEAASQQILVSAHANGLAAHISNIFPDRDRIYGMTALLGLPDNIIAHSYVAMGSPASVPSDCETSSKERIHFNSWVK
jgi:nitroreductase